jgi:magnesium chelatase family protein
VLAHLTSNGPGLTRLEPPPIDAEPARATPALDEVRGLSAAKYALSVAAAGAHGLLFLGSPGVGKSMLASRLPSLLPPPTLEERLEITRVLSAAGRWPGGLARERPYRAPHHTISYAGLVGGGANVTAGEITLAHRGVLFLDELPEFRREVLEALRQPLESGSVLISRAGRQIEMPARFQLVAAMNPCPCGYLGHPRIACSCPPTFVQRYRRRISGPLLDRIDMCVEITPPSVDELSPRAAPNGVFPFASEERGERAPVHGEASLRERVARAIERSSERQTSRRNSELLADELDRVAPLDAESRKLLSAAADRHGLSARAVQSLRRVARTIADLEASERVAAAHIAQALALRASAA